MRNEYLFRVHRLPERTDDGIGKEIKLGSPKILYDELETGRNQNAEHIETLADSADCLNLFRKHE